ncbi:hypothetical protein SAMN02745163_02956 [Clostridium cavendishii DSM 21758]|uniref:Uncharacterized protein n=1 Tax=Clostridium cavendishii DSM 21758 TaxID=1121302 RepID=A0A1M6NMT0_9CLOT|nr:hypothetical protein [Clostridium cavendishii]SHJ97057.1 hypothetical protein SAMN02745163_02956 [Clostridium cavendishii DSM 21758]
MKLKSEMIKKVNCYYIEYESMLEKGVFNVRSEEFLSLFEVIKNAEKSTNQKINWIIEE